MHSDIHEGRTESFVSLAVSQTLYPVAYFSSLPGCIKAPRDPNNTPNLPIRPSLRAPYPINGTSSHSDAQIKKLESPLAPSPCLNPSFSWEFKKFRDVGVSQGNPSFSTEERILNMTPMGMLAKSRESSGGRRTLRKDYCLLSTLGILNLFPESYVQSVTAGFGSWATARLNLCAPCLGSASNIEICLAMSKRRCNSDCGPGNGACGNCRPHKIQRIQYNLGPNTSFLLLDPYLNCKLIFLCIVQH